MKQYRSAFLASVLLLAALPLSGCGDPGDHMLTSDISLSAATTAVESWESVTFTVVSALPETGTACDTVLQYRAQGGGLSIGWSNIPGSETTRMFVLRPDGTGTLSVLARGKCEGSYEDWQYSSQVDVEVTESGTSTTLPTISTPTQPVPSTPVAAGGTSAVSSSGATCSNGEAVQYQFTATGTSTGTVTTAYSSSPSTNITWGASTTAYQVVARARCATTTTVVSLDSTALSGIIP